MIRVDSALGISSEPGVGEGKGKEGRGSKERKDPCYTHIRTLDTDRQTHVYKWLGFTVKTIRTMQLKPTVFEANYPDILCARRSVGFL